MLIMALVKHYCQTIVKAIYSIHGQACTINSYREACQFPRDHTVPKNGDRSHFSFKSTQFQTENVPFLTTIAIGTWKFLEKHESPSRNWCIFYTLQVKAVKKCIPDNWRSRQCQLKLSDYFSILHHMLKSCKLLHFQSKKKLLATKNQHWKNC